VKSLSKGFEPGYHSKGLVIIVCGVYWVLLEYNLVESTENIASVEIYPLTARNSVSGSDGKTPFPHVKKKFTSPWRTWDMDKYIMDIELDFNTISDIISWIYRSRKNIVRKFAVGKLADEDQSSDLQRIMKKKSGSMTLLGLLEI
jgi:hypothetical protein